MTLMKSPIVLAVPLALVVSLALAPAAAAMEPSQGSAGRGQGGGGGGHLGGHPAVGGHHAIGGPHAFGGHPGKFGGHPFVTHQFGSHHRVFPRPFFHRPFFRRFDSFGVFGSPLIGYGYGYGYASPPAYDAPAGYGQPAAIYNVNTPAVEIYNNAPPGGYSPPAGGAVSVPPAAPSVIEYATGRYELRGDGMTAPYTWVWIPNPPPGPPGAPPTGGSASGESSSRHGQVYRWTDDQGVMHMTDRWEVVPEQYRGQAKQNQRS